MPSTLVTEISRTYSIKYDNVQIEEVIDSRGRITARSQYGIAFKFENSKPEIVHAIARCLLELTNPSLSQKVGDAEPEPAGREDSSQQGNI